VEGEFVIGGLMLLWGIASLVEGYRMVRTKKGFYFPHKSFTYLRPIFYRGTDAVVRGRFSIKAGYFMIGAGIVIIALGIYSGFN
jgi:hypothetical protein